MKEKSVSEKGKTTMKSYKILLDSYKQVLESCNESEKLDKAVIKAKIRSLEPFADRTEEEVVEMFDSGAFNDVLRAYCRVAMKNCNLSRKKTNEVLEELRWLLDTVGANEILNKE